MPGSKPWKQRAKKRLSSMFRPDRLPSQMPHPTSSLSQSPVSRMSQSLSALPSTISNHLPNVASTPASQTSAIRMPAVATQTMSNIPLGTPNLYLEFTGSHTTPSSPSTRRQRMKMIASTAYAGITEIFQGIYDCSDMFLPLKTVAGLFLTISKVVEKVSGNETQLRELGRKLETILSIVQKYSDNDGIPVLKHRIEKFCEAIVLQMVAVENLQDHSIWARIAEGTKDAEKITEAFRTMSILCDIFQMDTQLNTNVMVGDILQHLRSGVINKLNHESTSYKTRHSSYGDPSGCMEGTRVKVLADLEAWAFSDDRSKVYWMVGMAGTGKSTISQTFCEILDGKNMLAASFFCSRASEKTNNVRLIVPTVAYELARASPSIKSEIVQAINDDEKLAEATYMNLEDQFKKLVYQPVRASIDHTLYKVVVIDAVDECTDLRLASSLIRLILKLVPNIPLKVFIASRDENAIREAFESRSDIRKDFYLHEVEKDVVRDDIRIYLETSLVNIQRSKVYHPSEVEVWPSQSELYGLLGRSGTLFIYASTAVRYITDGGKLYKSRLSEMANRGPEPGSGFQTDIDDLYGHILEKACERKPLKEVSTMRELVSIVVFLRNPLPADAIESILQIDAGLLSAYLSPLTSVIHFPVNEASTVAPFHASFPDFLTDSTRCSPERCPRFDALAASDGHTTLALRCLEHMNRFLKYNICDVPEESTVCRMGTTNSPENIDKISKVLKYSSLHWAFHLAEVQVLNTDLITALHDFVHKHLLHWIECVSTLGELQAGLKLLVRAATALLYLKPATADIRWDAIQPLVEDARRCVQMNFGLIQKNSFEIYHSALVWIPKTSSIRRTYAKDVCRVPKVILGLFNGWGPTEVVIRNDSSVNSIALSPDGSRVVSGSYDDTIRIWNVMTGEVEVELMGHTGSVRSVAFSPDGSRVVSGSFDMTVRIWNATTGEVEAELEGHTNRVTSVAFSQDGSRVVSGSEDKTVRIWNATTGEVEIELEGHTDQVTSVAFSQDGSNVGSGSSDKTVRIWNATTGKLEAELKGHTNWVTSVAFSKDGSRVVSGSDDKTARIWNTTTGKVQTKLKGHKNWVMSVVFSPDGSRVVSGSEDKTVRIWNAVTGEVEAELEGHTNWVRSVAFSLDGSRVVSGSSDKTVRIWNATTHEVEAELEGHKNWVRAIAFSWDGSRVISGSDDRTIRIWNAATGEVEAELKGHRNRVTSVAFSHDGSRIVSGSSDETVRIWNTATGEVQAELKGHTNWVTLVAFSQDGSQIISGSSDKTIRIWDAVTGESQLMTTPSITLPDSSEVHRAEAGKFHVIYPVGKLAHIMHPPLYLSDDRQWILGAPHDYWIPPHHHRSFSASSFSGGRICLGSESGRLLILDMNIVL